MMERVIDILVQNINKRPIAIVEIQNPLVFTRAEADRLLPYMLEDNGLLPAPAPYLLAVSQERGFLWKVSGQESTEGLEPLEFSMREVVARYTSDLERTKGFHNGVLQLLVLQWLTELAWKPALRDQKPEKLLDEVGFLEAISEASVLPGVELYDRIR